MNSSRNNLLKLMSRLEKSEEEEKQAPHAMHSGCCRIAFCVYATTLNEPEINDINNKLDFFVFLSHS